MHRRLLGALANRWLISGITNFQSGGDIVSQNNPNFSIGGTLDVLSPNGSPVTIPVSNTQLLGTPDVYLMPNLTCNPALAPGSHHYVNSACYSLPHALGVNGPYREPYIHGPAFTDSDLTAQKDFRIGEGKDVLFRFAAFNFLNHANTTYSSAADPNVIALSFSNEQNNNPTASAVPLGTALTSATNSNAEVFGYAPLRIGRRVTEMEIKFNF